MPAFNIDNIEQALAIAEAAEACDAPGGALIFASVTLHLGSQLAIWVLFNGED